MLGPMVFRSAYPLHGGDSLHPDFWLRRVPLPWEGEGAWGNGTMAKRGGAPSPADARRISEAYRRAPQARRLTLFPIEHLRMGLRLTYGV